MSEGVALVYNVLATKKGKKKAKKKAARHSGERETIVDHAVVFVSSAGGMTRKGSLGRLKLAVSPCRSVM